MKFIDLNTCNFCSVEKEDLDHVYLSCVFVQHFWSDVLSWTAASTKQPIPFSNFHIFFGIDARNVLVNHIIFAAKRHIYVCSLQGKLPNITEFQIILKNACSLEKFAAQKDGSLKKFYMKWNPVVHQLLGLPM